MQATTTLTNTVVGVQDQRAGEAALGQHGALEHLRCEVDRLPVADLPADACRAVRLARTKQPGGLFRAMQGPEGFRLKMSSMR